MQIFSQVQLGKNFYFSYSYNLTQSLQHNSAALSLASPSNTVVYNDMYIWNLFLLKPMLNVASKNWILPITYGFVDQAKINVFGHNLLLTVIGRRSRFFAGARFLVCMLYTFDSHMRRRNGERMTKGTWQTTWKLSRFFRIWLRPGFLQT